MNTQKTDIEITNVLDSSYITELKTGAWKKQLNELSDGTYEIEVYWCAWIYENERNDHYQKHFDNLQPAEYFYGGLRNIAQAKKSMWRDI